MKEKKLRIVLVGTEGEINLGFVIRLALNFEVDEIYLVSPLINPFSDEVKRFAAKAAKMVSTEYIKITDSLEEALDGVDLSICTSGLVGSTSDVLRHPITPRELASKIAPNYSSIAIVFGRESVGLTRDELAKCHLFLTIPANPQYPILNLSHAVAITLYELWTSTRSYRLREHANSSQLSRVLKLVGEIVGKIIDDSVQRERIMVAVKHILWRSSPSRGEASTLYYFFKKIKNSIDG